ncbi:MAG: hypothetical protein ACP5OG_06160 [Candidatus Nanoarchaeia archaeon]
MNKKLKCGFLGGIIALALLFLELVDEIKDFYGINIFNLFILILFIIGVFILGFFVFVILDLIIFSNINYYLKSGIIAVIIFLLLGIMFLFTSIIDFLSELLDMLYNIFYYILYSLPWARTPLSSAVYLLFFLAVIFILGVLIAYFKQKFSKNESK